MRRASERQFGAYIDLAKLRFERLGKRRVFEWQITLGLWGLLAASPIYVKHRPSDQLLALSLLVILLVYAVFWVRPIYTSGENDAETMFYYMEKAESLLEDEIVARPRPPDLKDVSWRKRCFGFLSWRNWWGWFQVLATAGLGILAYNLIGRV